MAFRIPWNDRETHLHVDASKQLQIAVKSDCILYGGHVERAVLEGEVVLNLTSATTFRDLRLRLKGKAVFHPEKTQTYSLGQGDTSSTYKTNIFTHDFPPFLETETPSLGAGRHAFSFRLALDDSIPFSLNALNGRATLQYKLIAKATRSVFLPDLVERLPIQFIRTYDAESLNFHQEVEIEDTWREKLIYSLHIPHKACAAGQVLYTGVKLIPVAKGVNITGITLAVTEHIALKTSEEVERDIVSVKYAVAGGRVNLMAHGASGAVQAAMESCFVDGQASTAEHVPGEVSAILPIAIPPETTPSHPSNPIIVKHRIRWTVSIFNADGHTSELRCSTPLQILHNRLLKEVRVATYDARRFLLGYDPPDDVEDNEELRAERELPSYANHTADRVANMYFDETRGARIRNPWVTDATWRWTSESSHSNDGDSADQQASTKNKEPVAEPSSSSLEWVSSELLISLSSTDASASPSSSSVPAPEPSLSKAPAPETQNLLYRSLKNLHHVLGIRGPNTGRKRASDAGTSHVETTDSGEDQATAAAVLQRAMRETPQYEIAARGFIGGGITPLESLRGLPSYEEEDKSRSEISSK